MDFWKDKIVMLTGASSGIGEALAYAMAERGAILGLLARRENLLGPIAAKIEMGGGKSRYLAVDVSDRDAVFDGVKKLQNEFGRIDIMIANAGIGGNNRATRALEADAVKKVIDINLIGAVNCVSAVLPKMLEEKSGHLVAISSLAGIRGLPKSAAYSASKAGMTAFFESARLDMKPKGVDVTIIQPGFIRTPLTDGRANKMPFVMDLKDSIPHFLGAIEKRKRFAAFPWQLATAVRAARFLPAWAYDRVAGGVKYRE